MGDYTTRVVKFGYENSASPSTMAGSSCTLNFNFLSDFESPVKEVVDSAFMIGGTRDKKRTAILQEEPDVRLSADLMSFWMFYFALGSLSTGSAPYTIEPASTLPWITFGRFLEPVEAGEQKLERVWGCKVDNVDFTLNKGAIGKVDVSLMGTGATIDTSATLSATIDYTKEPIYFFDGDVYLNSNALPEVTGIVVSTKNNLERRLSVSTASGYRAYTILEGGLDIGGKLTVGAKGLTMLNSVLSRTAGNTIELRVSKTHGGTFNGTITMPNVLFEDFPEKLTGIDPFEVAITYTALPTASASAIKLVSNTLLI